MAQNENNIAEILEEEIKDFNDEIILPLAPVYPYIYYNGVYIYTYIYIYICMYIYIAPQ